MKQKKIKEVAELQFDLLNLFHKNFSKAFHEVGDGPYNLNKNQKRAIMVIGMKGEIIPSVLGEYLDLQKGSLTSMIDALEEEGVIRRRGDPEDRRKTLISLTENGREYRNWLTGEIQAIVAEVLGKLDEDEIISYQESLENMIKFFKKLDERN
ncbi:Transcriptional regulator, MarR family [Methanosarcina siciliae C2J]|uniref:Transcriptional regulator, MarR family n=3 Tax=Methanosarcina siciliae TaxID=38027 RepID=A0A0E3PCG7_9EURY|nr:MarR family transcriptional regulator [Methanosarcina siciliae]AKB27845.1 Transcriptional regulator, MarR family [Methanosarcina siciliae T4/M]AKB31769.1 Transcriptional regulator, MarR family [Methanosarcina siciliae HI350]AKB35757.1 Transcriptional regulator, MarR family [Methanosarcina siciliae C2J]